MLDLSDQLQLFDWLETLKQMALPDLVFANAGMNINTGPDNQGESWQAMDKLLDLNVKSTMALIHHMALLMRQRGSGQLVLISSLAAWFGLPVTPSYSASKAAVKAYGEGLRGWLAGSGVGVSVVMPGYIQSDMCEAMPGPKPFMLTPAQAVQRISKGVARNRPRIVFPWLLGYGCWWLTVLPPGLSQWILQKLDYTPHKPGV